MVLRVFEVIATTGFRVHPDLIEAVYSAPLDPALILTLWLV